MIDNGHVTTEFAKKMSKASAVFKSFLGSLANIGAMWAIGEVFGLIQTIITDITQAEENLRQSAQTLGSELSNTSSSIKSYKDKINDLHKIINDSSSSIQEVAQARTDLMVVQDELIDKFGTEKNAIEDITYAINEQANALDNLVRKAYYEAVNQFNKLSLGQQVNHFIKNLFGVDLGTNFDTMVGDMERSIYNLKSTGNKELDDLIAKSYGIRQFSASESDVYKFYLDGSLNELQDKLYGIQDLIQGWDVSTEFKNDLARISNDIDASLTSYQNLYDQYILYEKILNNDSKNQYDDQYKLINDAKKVYNDAVISGNDSAIKTASENYAQTLQTAVDMAMQNGDSGVAEYFKSMYPELQEVVGQWRFNLNFEPNTDGLKDKLFDALDLIDGNDDGTRSFNVEQLNSFNTKAATDEQIEAYGTLINIAEEYELSISQLISLLEQMGIVQSEAAKMASEGFFAELEENFKEKFIDETLFGGDEATNEYNSIAKWFKGLNVDDKILAYELTVDYDTAEWGLEQFKAKLEEVKAVKEDLNSTPLTGLSEWLNVEANSEQLDTVKSNIDLLSSAFEKLNSEDLTQSDLDGLLFDLLQQFPQLAEYTDGTIETVDNLRLAIARLCNEQPDELVNTLKELAEVEGITEEAKDQILDLAENLERLSYLDVTPEINIEMDDTKDVIRTMHDELYDLAELIHAINDENGLHLDFEEARKYIDLFPELLEGAEMCADGTVKLNSDVANEFISSREAEIRADGQARITELENAKALYESRKLYAEAQLQIVKAGLQAESLLDAQNTIDVIENIEAKRQTSIQAGIDEVTANQQAVTAMGGDAKVLTDYITDAVDTSQDNIDIGASNAATSIATNSENAQGSILEVGNKVNEVAVAIQNAANGKTTSFSGVSSLKGASAKDKFNAFTKDLVALSGVPEWHKLSFDIADKLKETLGDSLSGGSKNTLNYIKDMNADLFGETTELEKLLAQTQQKAMDEALARLNEMKAKLDTTILGYDDAIGSIDKQIAMIKANAGIALDDYVAGIINSESDKKGKESSEKTFDWIETLIQNLERELQNLSTVAESTYTNWSERNMALVAQMSKTREEIGLQQAAYLRYMQEAESVGLSSYWKNLAKNGALDISTISDENLAEQISTYQEYIDKANAAQDAVYELNETLSGLYQTSFENVASQYDAILAVIETHQSIIEERLGQAEEQGYIVSVRYYEALMQTERDNIVQLQKEKNALISSLNNAVNSGQIDEGSEAFLNMQSQIDDVTLALEQANTAMIQYQNSIREIEWETFDLLQSRIEKVTGEADFLIDLMSNSELYDESGKLNDKGMATAGLHGMNYNVYMEQVRKYAAEIENLNKVISEDPYDQELINRRYELIELQQESILAAEAEKQAIIDLVDEGIQAELDALKELIDTYNESLNSQKELYDYQKTISEQTHEIAKLQKQLAAYQGDGSEEGRKKLQEIQTSLTEAQENLEETEYDKFISDSAALLDELYNEYELILNQRLDNIDVLLEEMIGEINNNSSAISDTITNVADSVGYTLSGEMSSIWSSSTESISSVITLYGDGVQSSLTNVISVLNTINSSIQSMMKQTDVDADTNIEAATDAITGNASGSTGGTTAPITPSGSSGISSGNDANNSSSNDAGNFFIYKKDSYPKEKLNKDTSIVDRLKFFNYDSSFDARKMYYGKMGFSGTYISNSKQNTDMIRWMKTKGYATGVYNLPKSEIAWTQEKGREVIISPSTGAMLTPLAEHDSVLSAAATRNMFEFFNDPSVFMEGLNLSKYSLEPSLASKLNQNFENHFQVAIEVNNPNNFEDFVYQLQHDKNVEKIIQAMTIGKLSGGGDLRKFRWN